MYIVEMNDIKKAARRLGELLCFGSFIMTKEISPSAVNEEA